ncbi:MAG: hypothetical protein VB070_09435 [Clostridiaceae bacterium]|nr:hypothetical protein [Clostridiaceae bacterium]
MIRKLMTLITVLLLTAMISASCSAGASMADVIRQGLGTVSRINKSADAGDADGNAQTDTVVAAVSLDSNGRIIAVKIDALQSRIAFTKEGKIATDPATLIKSYKEQGDQLGMKDKSGIGQEWNQEITTLENWLLGKSLSDLTGLALTSEGKIDDLKASVTISATDYLEAVKKAIADAG